MTDYELSISIDRAAIVQLTIDYCWAIDNGDWQALRQIFTPDAETQLGRNEQHGVDEVIERVSVALGPLDDSQHMISNHQITVDGDSAEGRCYLQAQHIVNDAPGGPLFMVAGRYEDQYVRTTVGWRISRRKLVTMWTDGNDQLLRKAKT